MIIKLKGITKEYGEGENKLRVLDQVDLTVDPGEILAITGYSGSGKSTLLSIMSGLNEPEEGSVCMDDVDLFSLSEQKLSEFRRKHFGFVFQQFNLIHRFTVKENIGLPFLFEKKETDPELLRSLCDMLEITELLQRYPAQLSGGQQQRVAIARALVLEPDIIFADEPTGNLDRKTGGKVKDLLHKIAAEKGKTLILATHDMGLAAMADRQITIVDGKIANGVQ